jgi:hypothetical protein
MSETPSEKIFSAQRKREDNARPLLIRKISFWVGGVILLFAILYGFPQTRNAIWMAYASPSDAEAVTVSTDTGIAVTDTSGNFKHVYPLTSQGGQIIRHPYFAIVADRLVYWSPDDTGLCIVGKDGPKGWVALYNNIGEHDKVVALRPSNGSVNVVIQDQSDTAGARAKFRPSKVVTVKVPEGLPTLMPEVSDAMIGDGGMVVRQPGGQFVSSTTDGGSKTLMTDEHAFDWDYSFKDNLLAATDQNQISVSGSAGKNSWNPAFLHAVPSVSVRQEKGEVWAEIAKPFGLGTCVLAYAPDGTLLGMRLKEKGRLMGPYYPVSTDIVAILENAENQK